MPIPIHLIKYTRKFPLFVNANINNLGWLCAQYANIYENSASSLNVSVHTGEYGR